MSKNGRSFLLLVSSGILFLMLFSVWTIRHCDKNISFRLVRAVICDEVDEQFQPVGTENRFTYGTRQLCLWFEYDLASQDCKISIKWYFNNKLVFTQTVDLMSERGKRTLCLLREDGSPLPSGTYQVVLDLNGQEVAHLDFAVERDAISCNDKIERIRKKG